MGILRTTKKTTFLVGIIMIAILLCFTSQVQAAQNGNYTYTLTDGKAQITDYTGDERDVTIPSTLDGVHVTSIGDWAFQKCKSLVTISIPQGVTRIGEYAFLDCTGLTSITIPDSVTIISGSAFKGCTGLINIKIPKGITSINTEVFWGCTGLTSISIPQGVTSIDNGAFCGCTGLTSISIPQGVTSIDNGAFYGCTGLTSISIPQSVTSIDYSAFYGCTGLTSITVDINNSTYTSVDGLLYNKEGTYLIACPGGLTSVTIPNGVTLIGGFWGCTDLTSIIIPDSVTSIGIEAFLNCTGLNSITIPQGVTSIGQRAFWGCEGLTSITIPKNVVSVDMDAFSNCSSLARITFNSATTEICDDKNTIASTAKIIGYDPSTAKNYATKYNRTFEVIGSAPDTSGMTEIKTTQSIVGPSKEWTIKLSGLVNESSLNGKIYVTNSQGVNQSTICTVSTVKGLSHIKVNPTNNYTPGDYILWIKEIESVRGTKLKNQVYLKFTVQ